MTRSKLIAHQLGNPTGIWGIVAGFIWNRRNAALNDTVLDLLALQSADRVLDIGFGGGYLLNRMLKTVTGGLVAGVDISPAMVAASEKRYQKAIRAGKLNLKCAAAEALPYPNQHFTKVCSVNSIFYWPDMAQGMREILRVLMTDGKVVICFTCKTSMEKQSFATNVRLYEAGEVEQIISQCGFKDVKTAFFSDKYRQYIGMTGKKSSGKSAS